MSQAVRSTVIDQLRDNIARHHRLLMTIGWVVLVAGSWLEGYDGGALGLALLLVTLWGLRREQRRSPDTPTHLRPGYLRGFSWLCILGLIAYGLMRVLDIAGIK